MNNYLKHCLVVLYPNSLCKIPYLMIYLLTHFLLIKVLIYILRIIYLKEKLLLIRI